MPFILRPYILAVGLSSGLEEAEGAAEMDRWPSERPLATDRLLLSSCLPLTSSGVACVKSGACADRLLDVAAAPKPPRTLTK